MKLIVFFIAFTCFQVSAATSYAQRISITKKNASLEEVLNAIETQSGYTVFFNTNVLLKARAVNINVKNTTLDKALDAVFAGQALTYTIDNKSIVVKDKPFSILEKAVGYFLSIDVHGTVTDEKNMPLPGATVKVKGTSKAVITNSKGEFELKRLDDQAVLVITYMGYKVKEIVAAAASSQIRLELDAAQLVEVAVVASTGYQKVPIARAAGSFSVVSDKAMSGKFQTNIMERLEGMVAGLTSFKNGSNPKANIQVRGVSTLTEESTSPLYVVDGAPFEGDLQAINPSDIESVTVLKDASAASIYGARSANGVIVITTRSGSTGKLKINYDASVKFTGLPNRAYANKMSSAELVDFQREMFNYRSGSYSSIDPRKAMNEAYRLFYDARQGVITEAELQKQLNVLRGNDRYDQVVNEFLRKTSITQQHNLSFSGGNDFYKYNLSGNYLGNAPYERAQTDNRVGFNLKNTLNLTKWVTLNIGLLGSNTKADYDNGYANTNVNLPYNPNPGMSLLDAGKASYYMLRNSNGSLTTNWLNSKSLVEINRLNSLGLQDENYNPVTELNKQHFTNTSKYLNLNLSANFKIIDGLTLDLLYQSERTENYLKMYSSKDSYKVKTQINDATVIAKDGTINRLIPLGGQVNERRGDANSSTMRAQFNYSKLFDSKHRVDVIAGTERRRVLTSYTDIYKYGYDDYSLNYKPINELALTQPTYNTQALFNQFALYKSAEKGFLSTEDRYVSFYGNGSYTYDNKLTVSGSIRMDQSNLFGTDPKYQYKPLWSAGLMYVVAENKMNWLDRLAIRGTYGINGNIPKKGGPYMISKSDGNNSVTGESQDYIDSPPNSGLRWEKTKVTNFGIDFSVLGRRLSGSIDLYNKATNDLLSDLQSDPTLGWNSLVVNYGSMKNQGVDVTLTSNNLTTRDFRWNTTLNFNYNKNELTSLETPDNSIYSYLNGLQNRVGIPMGSLYSVKYAGLDSKGKPKALTRDGKEVYGTDGLTVADLVYSGTTIPPYSASLQNTFSYKGFDLFLMFIYYGGNVMRDVTAPYLTKYAELNYTSNMERSALNYWKKPGDELIQGMAPAFNSGVGSTITNIWEARDQNIQKADYIKLRDITLSYNFTGNWLKKNYIQRMRLSLQVQNAWRWGANQNNLDTEIWNGTTLTPTRGTLYPASYTIGLSVNF